MVVMSSCYGGVAAGGGASGGGASGGAAAGGANRGGGAASQGGGGGGGGGSAESLQDLKKSVDELKKGQSQMRIDALKITAEELRRKETDQKVDELRREINEMRLRMPPPPGGAPPKIRRELPTPQPGKVFLEMPADAVVFVNETRIETASSYLTQPLEPGKEYVLSIEAVVMGDGQSTSRVKQVTIRGGEEVRLAYQDMDLADASWNRTGEGAGAPAHISVRVPTDARLTVHGVDCPLTSDTRTFDTPALEPGQKYYYLLKAEVVRDGRTIAQTKRIDFRSGERLTVSFDDLGANVVSSR
jgi:uncharacterized protein (TIGR03000 family)